MWYRTSFRRVSTDRFSSPPFGYHRTSPENAERIVSEGFVGDIAPDYFDAHFDEFYSGLSEEGKSAVNDTAEEAGYDEHEIELGFPERSTRNWERVVDALMSTWSFENPRTMAVWTSSDPLDPTFGDTPLEVDLEDMREFLNDHSYGSAHSYELAPDERNIPSSRFRIVSPEEMEEKPNPTQWWQ